MKKLKWSTGKVLFGQKLGRKLGFPTVNLNPALWPSSLKDGVYASLVKYENKTYKAALYFGPRLVLGETAKVLEIYILDFNKEIYEKKISWQIQKYLREARNFSTPEALTIQLKKDIEEVRRLG